MMLSYLTTTRPNVFLHQLEIANRTMYISPLLLTRKIRFSDISGKLDERIFAKNYSFLDEKREKEIEVLSKTLKKIKSTSKKEELKAELLK